MNEQESNRIQELCSKIAGEKDHKKFLTLVEELNRILSARNPSFERDERKHE
jgi:hypothetical protein